KSFSSKPERNYSKKEDSKQYCPEYVYHNIVEQRIIAWTDLLNKTAKAVTNHCTEIGDSTYYHII
ncbi:MAG TPA: hypothetical protein VFP25_01230, partial [Nitrososphaeraceae archaeon]|nr:hypothetical protein [Nitrososphaeraceae archaeon]